MKFISEIQFKPGYYCDEYLTKAHILNQESQNVIFDVGLYWDYLFM